MRFRWNQLYRQLSYFKREIKVSSHPVVFQIETTNHCPMKCIMCPRTNLMTRSLGYMDIKLFERVIKQLSPYTNLVRLHHFGDPLMHPQIDIMIRICKKHGLSTAMSVNPVLLTEEKSKKIIMAGLDKIQISLDGKDDESYKRLRGDVANYELAIKNINKFLEIKKYFGDKKPYTAIGMVLMDPTISLLEKFKQTWTISGIDNVVIKKFTSFGGSVNMDLADNESKSKFQKRNKYPCYKPWRNVVITWDGKVVPCCYDYNAEYIIGDLTKQTLEEIWNCDQMQLLRKQNIENNFKGNNLCARCPEKYGCPGFDEPKAFSKFFYAKLKEFFSSPNTFLAKPSISGVE